jgi:hypothetical protein
MKNIIACLIVALFFSTSVMAGECSSGVCRTPVRTTLSVVKDTVATVVTAPVRVAQKVTHNVQARRYCRRCR